MDGWGKVRCGVQRLMMGKKSPLWVPRAPGEADGRQCARTSGSASVFGALKALGGYGWVWGWMGGVRRARRGKRNLGWESGNRGSGGPLSAVIRLAGPVGVGGREHLGRGHPDL